MNSKKWVSTFMVLCTFISLAGCRPAAQPKYGPTTEGPNKPGMERTPPGEENPTTKEAPEIPGNPDAQKNIRSPQQEQRSTAYGNASQQADHIAQVLIRIPGVERAYVLLTGRLCLVGVDLKSDISGSKIDTVKYSVKEAAERTGPGYKAVVTADVDTVTRIRELSNGVRSGRPISSFADEIADILSRLFPET
ncbi:YhcN/YlaJ family sporulation lipoprotein [Effusibacillus consociatus]|uniref:YhcN/YlaJ family sporulation lipoprotein n=1 Tax=Effusibacillus consociatus TaxID=1117041 RepID=A0ABV9Q012_9BACL